MMLSGFSLSNNRFKIGPCRNIYCVHWHYLMPPISKSIMLQGLVTQVSPRSFLYWNEATASSEASVTVWLDKKPQRLLFFCLLNLDFVDKYFVT